MLARVCKSLQSSSSRTFRAPSSQTSHKPSALKVKPAAPAPRSFLRAYSASHGLSQEEVTSRVVEVIKSFNKVDANLVTPHSHFQKDLGLDSLETVELILNIEDEFAVDIPDTESEKIQSATDAINYIVSNPHAK